MSDEPNKGGSGTGISSAEYQRAVRQATTRKATIADLERKLADLTTERDTLKASVGTLTTERDSFKTKFETYPSQLKDENAKLKGQLRTIDHRKAIDGLVGKEAFEVPDPATGKTRKVKVKGDVLDDLLDVAKYKAEEHEAEGGTPDVERIKGFFAEAIKSHPWAVETAESTARASQPGPAGGRGNPATRASEKSAEKAVDDDGVFRI